MSNPIRYNSLDALRFLAFLKVFLLHLPEAKDLSWFHFIKQGGGTGVAFFFVLSGFLISDLLIKQKQAPKNWNAFRFFMRRVLRIWPLYFVGLGVGYFVAYVLKNPLSVEEGYLPQPLFSLFFLENYKMLWEGTYPIGPPLRVFWSLCIEEHFYLLWILLAVVVPLKKWPLFLLFFWGFGVLTRGTSLLFFNQGLQGEELFSSLDYFAAGSLIACLRHQLIPQLSTCKVAPAMQKSILVLGLLFFLFQHTFYTSLGIYGISVSAWVYAAVIGVFVLPQRTVFQFNPNHLFEKWGKWTYGLYVWHTPVILLTLKLVNKTGISEGESLWLVMVALFSFLGSLVVARLSFHYIESPFLRLREKYYP